MLNGRSVYRSPTLLCKRPFYKIRNFILYFVSLLLTSPSFCYLLDYSAHFRLLLFTSAFGLSYLRMFLTILVYVMFYLHTISDSRMFVVPILTWLVRNTASVLWNLLVCHVATIHKNSVPPNEPWLKYHLRKQNGNTNGKCKSFTNYSH